MSLINQINESALITEQVDAVVQQFKDLGFNPEEVFTITDFMEGVETLEEVSAAMARAGEMDWLRDMEREQKEKEKRQVKKAEPIDDKELEQKAGASSVPQKGHQIITPNGMRVEILKHFQGVVTFKGKKGEGRIKANMLIPAKADRDGKTMLWAVKKP